MLAANKGRGKVVKYLIEEAKCNIEAKDKSGKTGMLLFVYVFMFLEPVHSRMVVAFRLIPHHHISPQLFTSLLVMDIENLYNLWLLKQKRT